MLLPVRHILAVAIALLIILQIWIAI